LHIEQELNFNITLAQTVRERRLLLMSSSSIAMVSISDDYKAVHTEWVKEVQLELTFMLVVDGFVILGLLGSGKTLLSVRKVSAGSSCEGEQASEG
jgi:hypothetical protein